MTSTYHTTSASCPRCRALDGKPREDDGNIAGLHMGHQMYYTTTGRIAACLLGMGPAAVAKAEAYRS